MSVVVHLCVCTSVYACMCVLMCICVCVCVVDVYSVLLQVLVSVPLVVAVYSNDAFGNRSQDDIKNLLDIPDGMSSLYTFLWGDIESGVASRM